MLAKMFDSQDLPPADRADAWQDITAGALVANEFSIAEKLAFQASLRSADLGEAQVTAIAYSSLRSRRTPALIRQSDPGMYAVGLIVRGQQSLVQGRCEASLEARDLVLYSTSRPYTSKVDVQQGMAASVVMQIPRALLPLPENRVDRLMATRLTGREGIGGLLAAFLTHLATDTAPCQPADRQRVGTVLTDLITGWLAHHIDALDQVPAETHQHLQFLEIQAFILRYLSDPDLFPAVVAAAHHLSLRTLHRLFHNHAHGATVAAYIRRERLRRAQRDLADPLLATRPIHAIAAHWGFTRPADFTRAFRTAYGTTPTEYRHALQHTQSGTHRLLPGTRR